MIKDIKGHPTNKRSQEMYKWFYSKKFLLHWGGLADPFCNFEQKNKMGLKLMEALAEENYPTLFSFKGNTFLDKEYMNLLEQSSKQKNFAFQVSLVTGNDKIAKSIEVGVPSPTKRLEAIKILSDMGYWTILRLRPFLIGITDIDLDELLERGLQAGIKGVSTEFFAMDSRANTVAKNRYAWLEKVMDIPDIKKYYRTLSPSERGGYMRLNRMVKEPYAKTIYKFCAKHGLVCGISDPDFKELNTSGSCCAMPDSYPENRGLENWTRNQFTYHIKEARRLFHKEGIIKKFYFNDIYPAEPSYLTCSTFGIDHVATVNTPMAYKSNVTARDLLQEKWNNLNGYSNPRNYFHGKILPLKVLDEEGNLIFEYNPMEYEETWKKEGIDLTR